MLTAEEKNKIELEERYRNEIAQQLKPKSKLNVVENVIKILQGLAIISGIWATYYAYTKQSQDRVLQEKAAAAQTAKEFRRGFYDKQFELYGEAAEVTAILATETIGSKDYEEARKKFYRLFWGELSIVEDKTVEAKMIEFQKLLTQYEGGDANVTPRHLQQASLRLAHSASKYTIHVWFDSTEKKNYNR